MRTDDLVPSSIDRYTSETRTRTSHVKKKCMYTLYTFAIRTEHTRLGYTTVVCICVYGKTIVVLFSSGRKNNGV